jgi:hypothetical protein
MDATVQRGVRHAEEVLLEQKGQWLRPYWRAALFDSCLPHSLE